MNSLGLGVFSESALLCMPAAKSGTDRRLCHCMVHLQIAPQASGLEAVLISASSRRGQQPSDQLYYMVGSCNDGVCLVIAVHA